MFWRRHHGISIGRRDAIDEYRSLGISWFDDPAIGWQHRFEIDKRYITRLLDTAVTSGATSRQESDGYARLNETVVGIDWFTSSAITTLAEPGKKQGRATAKQAAQANESTE